MPENVKPPACELFGVHFTKRVDLYLYISKIDYVNFLLSCIAHGVLCATICGEWEGNAKV